MIIGLAMGIGSWVRVCGRLGLVWGGGVEIVWGFFLELFSKNIIFI